MQNWDLKNDMMKRERQNELRLAALPALWINLSIPTTSMVGRVTAEFAQTVCKVVPCAHLNHFLKLWVPAIQFRLTKTDSVISVYSRGWNSNAPLPISCYKMKITSLADNLRALRQDPSYVVKIDSRGEQCNAGRSWISDLERNIVLQLRKYVYIWIAWRITRNSSDDIVLKGSILASSLTVYWLMAKILLQPCLQ